MAGVHPKAGLRTFIIELRTAASSKNVIIGTNAQAIILTSDNNLKGTFRADFSPHSNQGLLIAFTHHHHVLSLRIVDPARLITRALTLLAYPLKHA